MVDVGTQTDEVYIIDKTDINHPEYNPRNKAPNQIDLLIIITCEDYFNIYNLLFNDLSENYISQKFSPQHSSYKFKLLEIFNFINDPIGKFYYNDDIESEYNILKQKTLSELWCDDLTVFEKEYSSFTKAYYSYMGFEVKDFEKVKHKKLVIRDKHSSV